MMVSSDKPRFPSIFGEGAKRAHRGKHVRDFGNSSAFCDFSELLLGGNGAESSASSQPLRFQRFIDSVQQVLDGQLPKFTIRHEFSENFLVAFHPVDDEAFEGFLENVTEVLLGIRRRCFLERFTFDCLFLYLVKKQLVGLGKVGAKSLV